MKREELLGYLRRHNCKLLPEDGRRSWWRDSRKTDDDQKSQGECRQKFELNKRSVVPRHNEIDDELARKICRDLGIMSKQAVVVIHGIGEQRPMSTLRNFVEAVMSPQLQEAIGAKQAVKVKKTDYRSKPDRLSESFELRRLDYVDKRANRTTHFYEYYWADRMRKTRFAHLFGWMARLLFLPWRHLPWRRWWRHLRNRRRISLFRNIRRNWFRDLNKVPPQHRRLFRLFRGIWLILFLLPIVSLTGFLIFSVVPGGNLIVLAFGLPGVVAIGRLVWAGISSGLLNSAGDAARYLNAAPANIAERHAIRTNGIALLKKLHDPTSGYDRIVIVGHSLGSVIGYDMLTHYWAQVNGDIPIHPGSDESMALNRLEAPDQTINDFQKNQDCLWKVLATRSLNNCQAQRWLVSDFVTVGSPLSYGAFLFAESGEDFERRVGQRELPVCPPISNGDKRPKSFAWKDEKHGLLYLHHAAQFTLTQWTNFYFPGDPLAGKLAEVFSSRDVPGEIVTRGPGICDIELEHPSRLKFLKFRTHTWYWRPTIKKNACAQLQNIIKMSDKSII